MPSARTVQPVSRAKVTMLAISALEDGVEGRVGDHLGHCFGYDADAPMRWGGRAV